jgi:hypothetical protein
LSLVAAITSCGGGGPSTPPQDGGSAITCEQQQRDYVNLVLAPDQQTDVAATVRGVIGASDFPQAMPYCSGTRPGARGASELPSTLR